VALPKYGFGRSELLPVKSCGAAMAEYVGKYLSKPADVPEDWGRFRRVEYHHGGEPWRTSTCQRAAVGGVSWVWRTGLKAYCEGHRVTEGDLADRLGPRWAWKLKGDVFHSFVEAFARGGVPLSLWCRARLPTVLECAIRGAVEDSRDRIAGGVEWASAIKEWSGQLGTMEAAGNGGGGKPDLSRKPLRGRQLRDSGHVERARESEHWAAAYLAAWPLVRHLPDRAVTGARGAWVKAARREYHRAKLGRILGTAPLPLPGVGAMSAGRAGGGGRTSLPGAHGPAGSGAVAGVRLGARLGCVRIGTTVAPTTA